MTLSPGQTIVTYLRNIFQQGWQTRATLSPGQTIATCQRNISQYCWAQHVARVWLSCCAVFRPVGPCWFKYDHLLTWANNTQHVATRRKMVAKRTQHVPPNNVATCCVDMLRSFGGGFTQKTGSRCILDWWKKAAIAIELQHACQNAFAISGQIYIIERGRNLERARTLFNWGDIRRL